jgi:hypothetical protein
MVGVDLDGDENQYNPVKLTSSLARKNSALFLLKLREVQRAIQSTIDCVVQDAKNF